MCFFYNMGLENSRFILFSILVGTLITVYQQLDKLRDDINEMREKSEGSPDTDVTIKNIKKIVEKLKEELKHSEAKVRKLQSEIELYQRDRTGLVDYAYGGQVISIGNTETYESEGLAVFGLRLCGQTYLQKRILENSVMPGDCWPIRGHEGSAVIELIAEIFVTKVSLEHAPKELLPNGTATSAPKEFSLWGLHDNNSEGNGSSHFFGQFIYAVPGPEVQTFIIPNKSNKVFKTVEFKIHSNHGHPDFTCIYRVRIHGHTT